MNNFGSVGDQFTGASGWPGASGTIVASYTRTVATGDVGGLVAFVNDANNATIQCGVSIGDDTIDLAHNEPGEMCYTSGNYFHNAGSGAINQLTITWDQASGLITCSADNGAFVMIINNTILDELVANPNGTIILGTYMDNTGDTIDFTSLTGF
jgi:hypothetical protein